MIYIVLTNYVNLCVCVCVCVRICLINKKLYGVQAMKISTYLIKER